MQRRRRCSPRLVGLAVAVMSASATTAGAQGIPGEPPLPIQFVDTTPAGRGATIRTHFSSGGHPISLLDSVGAPAGASPAAGSGPLRVLFIGNSLTYYNAMARMFAALAAAGLRRPVVVGVAAYPGASMGVLWQYTDAREAIRRFAWDYVVMQARPAAFDDSVALIEDAQRFHQEIGARKARTVIWGQYRAGGTGSEAQAALNSGIAAAARAMGAVVARVPEAWEAVRQADTTVWRRLFVRESDAHPSPLGSYLIALAADRAIAGPSPVGLPRAAGAAPFSMRDVDLLQRAAGSSP